MRKSLAALPVVIALGAGVLGATAGTASAAPALDASTASTVTKTVACKGSANYVGNVSFGVVTGTKYGHLVSSVANTQSGVFSNTPKSVTYVRDGYGVLKATLKDTTGGLAAYGDVALAGPNYTAETVVSPLAGSPASCTTGRVKVALTALALSPDGNSWTATQAGNSWTKSPLGNSWTVVQAGNSWTKVQPKGGIWLATPAGVKWRIADQGVLAA